MNKKKIFTLFFSTILLVVLIFYVNDLADRGREYSLLELVNRYLIWPYHCIQTGMESGVDALSVVKGCVFMRYD